MIFNIDNFLLLWIGIMAVVASFVNVMVPVNVLGKTQMRFRWFFAIIVFFPIFWAAALAEVRNTGDAWGYIVEYLNNNNTFSDIFKHWNEIEKGQGFELLQIFIKKLFGNNSTAFRVSIALIQSIPLVAIYRKYSENYLVSIFLFVASTSYIAWMMNGLRQFVAVCLVFACLPLIVKKKYVPAIIIILLASTIHQTAVIMLPVIFLVQLKPWKPSTLFFIAGLSVVLYFYAERSGVISQEVLESEDGTNPIRVIVDAVPMLLAFWGRKKISDDDDLLLPVCVNMSVITTGINIVAMLTSGIMTGRLPVYTGLYSYILLPYLIKRLFNKSESKVVYFIMIVLYIAFFAYSVNA